ncbi:MAG: MmgE/PrpD family protein, partial [Thermoplasmatota archaeon]
MTEYSKELAKFIVDFVYEDIPKNVVEKTKMHFLDTIGVTIGAFDQPWSQMVIDMVKQTQGSAQSKVIGLDGKYPAMMAALSNGTMAHGIDMDDSGAEGWAHPGACLVPAGFAVGEDEKISGKELITALLLGYEINGRVDGALYPSLRDKGFHATAVVGTIGAAVTAGKILKLDEEQMVNALGLAGTQAAGLEEWLNTGDMSKRLHAGKAAMNGVISAQLAKKGYTGPSSVFEGKYGLASTHTDDYDLPILLDGLGKKFKIMDAKFKPFACCHELCGPIRLALKAQKEHDIEIEDIEKIRIGLNHVTAENQLKVAETPLHAQNHP